MQSKISRYLNYFSSNIGRCERCMRQSLTAGLVAWLAYGICLLVWPSSHALALAAIAALALTALWGLHIAVYAARAEAKSRNEDQQTGADSDSVSMQSERGAQVSGRRNAMGVVLRAAAVGVVASIPVVLWPSASYAFCGQCTKDDDCGGRSNGWCCKNTAPVNAGYVCNECRKC